MAESIECAADIVQSTASLAGAVRVLFTGLSFGHIPPGHDIEDGEYNLKFSLILSRASQSFYTLYLTLVLIGALYYDFNPLYNLSISSVALFVSFWLVYLSKKRMTDPDADGISGFPYFLHYMSTLILCGRISTTSFYLIENILNGS
eukprot:40082_1